MSVPVQFESERNSAPLEALAKAGEALSRHPECFWTRHTNAPLTNRDDIILIIRRLRENGGHSAWQTAREIERCL